MDTLQNHPPCRLPERGRCCHRNGSRHLAGHSSDGMKVPCSKRGSDLHEATKVCTLALTHHPIARPVANPRNASDPPCHTHDTGQWRAKGKPKPCHTGFPWHPAFSPHCHAACGEAALPLLEHPGGLFSFSVSAFQNFSFYPHILQSAAIRQLPEIPAAHRRTPLVRGLRQSIQPCRNWGAACR